MDDSAAREVRHALRRVQEHLSKAHLSLGAQQETISLVEVVHHPTIKLAALNYVTPRKGTAWVSGKDIQKGIDHLRTLDRTPRVHYMEGLFPPQFAKTLYGLGLHVEQETPIMLYRPEHTSFRPPNVPDNVVIRPVNDAPGCEMWWYAWRNAYYDVVTMGTEPLFVGQNVREIMLGHRVDLLLYHYGLASGVVRITIHDSVAHITAMALLKDLRTHEMTLMLQAAAMQAAIERGCDLVFVSGASEEDRQRGRELGFADSGSIVCYSEQTDESYSETNDSILAQPVLVLR